MNEAEQLTLEKLNAIAQECEAVVVTKTLDGIVTGWSVAAERLLGYSPEEMIGQPITRIIPLDRQQEEPAILDRLLKGESVIEYETVRVAKNGRRLSVVLTITPLRGSAGQIVGATKNIRESQRRASV